MRKARTIRFVPDFLFVFSLCVLILILIFGAVFRNIWVLLCGLVLALWMLFRVFSRNLPARAKENRVFCRVLFAPLRLARRAWRKLFPDRHHIRAHCPSCGVNLRLQKKKGDFTVTCPKCGARFPMHIR